MTTIAPTITAETTEAYDFQLERIEPFARRIHIDLMDGVFAPTTSVTPQEIWWPANRWIDLHVMYERPFDHTDLFISLGPQLVIVHAEAKGNFVDFATKLHARGIEVGVALLPDTPVDDIVPGISLIDHVLVFSGNLGHQGGSKADPNLLTKVGRLRRVKPSLEIGWDGGVNEQNASALARAGIDVLNVGGCIQTATDPGQAYDALVELARS